MEVIIVASVSDSYYRNSYDHVSEGLSRSVGYYVTADMLYIITAVYTEDHRQNIPVIYHMSAVFTAELQCLCRFPVAGGK